MPELEVMTMFVVALVAEVRVPPEQFESAHVALTLVMDHLVEQETADPRLSDADLSVNLHEGRVELGIAVAVGSPADAFAIGKAAIRSAIHGAGGFTPGWDEAKWSLEEDAGTEQDLIASA
jgi:hypothetical protein